MDKKWKLTRILAIIGTILVWLPITLMVVSFFARLIMDGVFLGDYLLPAELFAVTAVGFVLLLWAAIRSRAYIKAIAITFGVAVATLLGTQGLAVVTGLAHGEQEPTGWRVVLVMGVYTIFVAAVIYLGILGIRLINHIQSGKAAG